MATEKKADKADQIVKLSDVVNFTVSYPKDFKGKRYMKEGKVYPLHRLHAQRLEKKGLGKITA